MVKSRKNRSNRHFLDFFCEIENTSHSDESKTYPNQLLCLDLNQSYLKENGNEIMMIFFPPPKTSNRYWFEGLENNSSLPKIKIISRSGGRTFVKKVTPTGEQRNFMPYDPMYTVKKKFSFLSKRDREHLGEFFKNDKNYWLDGASQRTTQNRVSHSYAKGLEYTSEMQDRMLRQDVSATSLKEFVKYYCIFALI